MSLQEFAAERARLAWAQGCRTLRCEWFEIFRGWLALSKGGV